MPENGAPEDENKHKIANKCLFCFSAQINKVVADSSVKPDLAPYHVRTVFIAFDHQILRSQFTASFEARAPPHTS